MGPHSLVAPREGHPIFLLSPPSRRSLLCPLFYLLFLLFLLFLFVFLSYARSFLSLQVSSLLFLSLLSSVLSSSIYLSDFPSAHPSISVAAAGWLWVWICRSKNFPAMPSQASLSTWQNRSTIAYVWRISLGGPLLLSTLGGAVGSLVGSGVGSVLWQSAKHNSDNMCTSLADSSEIIQILTHS